MFGYGLGISAHKKSEPLDLQGVPWCGKQDLNQTQGVNSGQSCIIVTNIGTKSGNIR